MTTITDVVFCDAMVKSDLDRLIVDVSTGVLISPHPDQEGKKLQRQKILSFIFPISNHNWRNIITIYTTILASKRNIVNIKQSTSGSRSG